MNFIAGALLLFMGEEDCFWALTVLVEDLLPGYFAIDLVAAQVDQLVFKHLVSALYLHLHLPVCEPATCHSTVYRRFACALCSAADQHISVLGRLT